MRSKRFKWFVVAVTVGAVVALAGLLGAALAGAVGGGPQAGNQSPTAPGVRVRVTGGGHEIDEIRIVTQDAQFITGSTSYVTPPGALITVTVPPKSRRLITADFTAETSCFGGTTTSPNWCLARILVGRPSVLGACLGGVEAYPKADVSPDTLTPFALDSSDNGRQTQQSFEGHAFSRSIVFANALDVTQRLCVIAQVRVTNRLLRFWVDDIHLRAMTAKDGFGLP